MAGKVRWVGNLAGHRERPSAVRSLGTFLVLVLAVGACSTRTTTGLVVTGSSTTTTGPEIMGATTTTTATTTSGSKPPTSTFPPKGPGSPDPAGCGKIAPEASTVNVSMRLSVDPAHNVIVTVTNNSTATVTVTPASWGLKAVDGSGRVMSQGIMPANAWFKDVPPGTTLPLVVGGIDGQRCGASTPNGTDLIPAGKYPFVYPLMIDGHEVISSPLVLRLDSQGRAFDGDVPVVTYLV